MEYRQLGHSGIKVSTLCMGSMQFGWTADEPLAHRILDEAFERGVNFIDTADIYSRWVDGNPGGVSETIIGAWLKGRDRTRVILATKVRGPMGDDPNDQGLSRRHILQAIEGSITRLGTDYVDLYQLHWPDDATDIEETLHALDDLIRLGWVRYIGCSNYKAWQLVQALWTSDRLGLESFVSLQPHYNLIHREEYERELADVCLEYNIGVIPYSPLAGGFLTGKYEPNSTPQPGTRGGSSERIMGYIADPNAFKILKVVKQIAQGHQTSPSSISIAWLLSQASVSSAIIGPRTLEQLSDNLTSTEVQLSQEELANLDEVSA